MTVLAMTVLAMLLVHEVKLTMDVPGQATPSGLVLRNVVDHIPATNRSFVFPAGLVSGETGTRPGRHRGGRGKRQRLTLFARFGSFQFGRTKWQV